MTRAWKIVLLALATVLLGLPVAAGPAQAAPATVSPRTYAFGNVRVGVTKSKVVTLSIAKGFALSDYDGTGAAAPFGVAALSASCFDPGPTTCKVTEIFRPKDTLSHEASTRFTICPVLGGDCGHYFLDVSGTGTPPGRFSTGGINFGTVAIGKTALKPVKLTIDPGYILGGVTAGVSDLFEADPVGACSSTCTVAVRFRPSVTGNIEGNLTAQLCPAIGSDPCVTAAPVKLLGRGSEAATVSTSAISFGTREIGSTTKKTFSLTLEGGYHVSSIEVVGDDLGNRFTVVGDNGYCSGDPGPGTCTLTVSFTPWYLEEATGAVSFDVCDPAHPERCRSFNVALGGKGSLPGAVSPATVSFGKIKVGQRGTKSVRVVKIAGWHVVDTFFGDEPDGPFSSGAVDACAHDVASKECFFPVMFDPTVLGNATTEMTVVMCPSFRPAEPCVDLEPVTVTGSGAAPGRSNVTTLSFGNVDLDSSVTKSFTVNPDPGWQVVDLLGDGSHQEGAPFQGNLDTGCATPDTVCTVAERFQPTTLGLVHATVAPFLCQTEGELCVELPAVKLTGKGV